ncbi:MAG: GNAT family protein [Alphaproteobacteria bacterium]
MRLLRPRSDMPPAVRTAGKGIYLRAPQEDDWADWASLREESRDFLVPWEPAWSNDALSLPAFRRRLRQYASDWRADAGYSFFIFRTTGDELLGGISLSNVRRGIVMSASLGYWVGQPHARQGHGTAAVRAALRFAFTQLQLNRVEAACIPENDPSRTLLENVGFEREGFARKYLRINGEWRDHLLFGMLAEDFKSVDVTSTD